MKIRFSCKKCDTKYIVDSIHSGKKANCKKCGSILVVPTLNIDNNQIIYDEDKNLITSINRESSSAISKNNYNELCPLCGRNKILKKTKLLYGQSICKKCYYYFANLRQFAFFIDVLLWRLFLYPLGYILGYIMASHGSSQAEILDAARILDYTFPFLIVFKDGFSGHSIGKAICKVKVIDNTTGLPISMQASLKRNLPILIPLMPLVIGSELLKGHRTGDKWSNTKVIWKLYSKHPIFSPENV